MVDDEIKITYLIQCLWQTEMFTPSPESRNTRPFKILISLLDTWEIGSALTEELIMDTLSIANPSAKTPTTDGDDEVRRLYSAFE